MSISSEKRVLGTVFVARKESQDRAAVRALAVSEGHVTQSVDSLDSITEMYDRECPACVVTDISTIADEHPEFMSSLEINFVALP